MQTKPLLPLEDALSALLDKVEANTKTCQMPIADALNKIAAADIQASLSVPPFDNSAVDGYAFRIEDLQKTGTLPVSMRVAAGDAPGELLPGQAARIFTGAPVPKGADCVIMQESTEVSTDGEQTFISTSSELNPQQNIRPAGQDFVEGQNLLRKGDVLRPQNIALLASAGVAEISVYQPLKVAVVSTGDELALPGQALKPGQIYNSNQFLLNSFLQNYGFEICDIGVVADNLEDTKGALIKAAEADIIISSGGASVGEEDYIKTAIEELGSIDFWRIAIKPGKPFMLGEVCGVPILGLPGNPSAVLVTFLLLARPVLMKRQGCRNHHCRSMRLPLGFSVKSSSIRREFMRVRLDQHGHIMAHPNQSSGMMSSSCWAEGFAVIPENTSPAKGELIEFIPFTSLLQLPETLLDIE
jgi:molybdopterin molybdotransferase